MALLAVGCEDQLNAVQPEDQLAPDVVFSDEAGANGALIGVYSLAQDPDVLNGTATLAEEWQSDNIAFEGSFTTFQDISNYDTQSDNGSIFSFYDGMYNTIGLTNFIISRVPSIDDEGFTEEERTSVIAEALFMRALIYFKLADLFGQPIQQGGSGNLSVPLVLLPIDESGNTLPARNTIGEVYAQIESDLLTAIPSLTNADNSRATQGAAQALLSRLYLYQDRFPEAADFANRAISAPQFRLAANYNFYNTTSPEFFFTLVNTAIDGQGQLGFSDLTVPAPVGRGDAPISNNLIAAYQEEQGDLRFQLVTQGRGASNRIRTFTTKYPEAVNNSDNAPVLRITEAYTIRAEANFRAGLSVGSTPLADINLLRSRAGLQSLQTVDLDIILNEKRKELAFEGQRRMDLLRNGRSLRRPGMPQESESAAGAFRTIFPIPNREVELAGLTQNTGY